MQSLKELLELMNENNASDLHLTIGTPPRIRINGKLSSIETNALTLDNITKLLSEYINKENFDKINLEEKFSIEQKYNTTGINYRLFDFDEKIFNNNSDYDLAITRSGASAIAELACLNIPFIAIPFPHAKDDHQYFNAKFYESANSCWLMRQDNFNINYVADLITQLFTNKNEYFKKKENLEKISNQNTWNNVNKKLLDLINEN